MTAGMDLIRKHRETFGKTLSEFIDESLAERYDAGYSIGYVDGIRVFVEIARRNYAATVRRGLITPETRIPDFIRKIIEEERELIESWNTEESTFDPTELADIALVCFAMAQHYGIDLIDEMRKKVEFNETRPISGEQRED